MLICPAKASFVLYNYMRAFEKNRLQICPIFSIDSLQDFENGCALGVLRNFCYKKGRKYTR